MAATCRYELKKSIYPSKAMKNMKMENNRVVASPAFSQNPIL